MPRFTFLHGRDVAVPTAPRPSEEARSHPLAGEVVFEIGVVVALHLVVAVAVLTTLGVLGLA